MVLASDGAGGTDVTLQQRATVDLTAANWVAGPETINSGILELNASNAITDNTVDFAPGGGGTLFIGQATGPITVVDGTTTAVIDQATLPSSGGGVNVFGHC